MQTRIRIGLLTPSSNTIMEPRVAELLAGLPEVTAHFGRFRVVRIAMSDEALGQFTFEPQLAAAELLADAKCDVIAWGGTSGGWLGAENDHALCRAITDRTGVPATTSTLATLDAFRALGITRYGLATPYLEEVQSAIVANFAGLGFDCVQERHLEDPGNFTFAQYDETTIGKLIRDVAERAPEAIAVFCTNFDGPRVAPVVERETGIPVLDSISVTLWHALRRVGFDTAPLSEWGRIFDCTLPEDAMHRQATASA
ncbi:aspartate/glutamate racemase family protein [Sedimentitalea sp. JM2-8]|uniref:Aspartate/glutamate racemase family protein n=1 Tax=Sedimentitalea xiamensis TaxID=3050037 RepID=A0ABT7FIN7_9RHOB|nr:aspartate/glutamate racemase family protein [Sedimentitalea xiamensis]MDK3075002.1 aspartate/glutamate racemase family protein [Sedimentitalea xiamensis]